MTHCRKHPNVKPFTVCPACLGEKGGRVTSPAKAAASARNGRLGGHLGGRPKLPRHTPACDVTVTGRHTADCPRCQYDARRIA